MAGLLLSLPTIHAQSYSIGGFKVAGGGGSSSNGQYSVSGAIGQPGSTSSTSASSNLVITWSNPADIGYGTPLGASQLNATANVPGSFAYNPPAGTVLPAGSAQVLSVTFTPVDTADYNVATDSVTVSILKAPLTVTANNTNKLYGAALPVLTLAYSGFVNGDTAASLTTPPSLTTTATAGSPAGVYPITASAAADPNYAISYVNGALTVSKAPLTITADNKTMRRGSPVPPLTASYSGFVNGDTPANLTTPASLTTTATSRSPQGKYPIVVSGATSPDYAITFVNGVLTVTWRGFLTPAPGSNSINAAQSNFTESLTVNVKSGPTPASMSVTNSKAVTFPPQVEIEHLAVLPGGQAQLTLRGQPGQACLLEVSTDLTHWQVLQTCHVPTARFVFVDQSATGSVRRFYRVSTAP
jgi:hypothetical protein